jgi:hypothetical protein
MKMGLVYFPRARTVPIPPVTAATWRDVFWKGVKATMEAAFAFSVVMLEVGGTDGDGAEGACGGAGGAGRAAGGTISPCCVTIAPRTTSSSRLMPKWFRSGAIESKNLVMLFEYRVEDWVGSREGRSVYPIPKV